jgi:hypothetical protein
VPAHIGRDPYAEVHDGELEPSKLRVVLTAGEDPNIGLTVLKGIRVKLPNRSDNGIL